MAGNSSVVRVAVVGDPGVGKTSLIAAAAQEVFPQDPAPVLPPTRLPSNTIPYSTPVDIIDTSSRPEHWHETEAALRRCDAVVLCFASDRLDSLNNLHRKWFPELARVAAGKPVIVVGCRWDLPHRADLTSLIEPVVEQFKHQLEVVLHCSAQKLQYTQDAFYYAVKAVKCPMGPLFDRQNQRMKPLCTRAFKRIFMLCDGDNDGCLTDEDLNAFQIMCFQAPLQRDELDQLKSVVRSRVANGVDSQGVTLKGFMFLNALFIEQNRIENTWTILQRFGYGTDLHLQPALLERAGGVVLSEQACELTAAAVQYLRALFARHDKDNDKALNAAELDELFSTCPTKPWDEEHIRTVLVPANKEGNLPWSGFVTLWSFFMFVSPRDALAALLYTGYKDESVFTSEAAVGSSAGEKLLRVVPRRRKLDSRTVPAEPSAARSVFSCYVFGPAGCGKTTLLTAFVASQRQRGVVHGSGVGNTAVNVLRRAGVDSALLFLHEIPEAEADRRLVAPDAEEWLRRADAAMFVFDSSDTQSFRQCHSALIRVAQAVRHVLPCFFVAAKDDLPVSRELSQEILAACESLQIPQPVAVSAQQAGDDLQKVFEAAVHAAQNPEQYIPMTPMLRAAQEYQRLLRRVLVTAGGIAGMAAVAYAVHRVWMCADHAVLQHTTAHHNNAQPSSSNTTIAIPRPAARELQAATTHQLSTSGASDSTCATARAIDAEPRAAVQASLAAASHADPLPSSLWSWLCGQPFAAATFTVFDEMVQYVWSSLSHASLDAPPDASSSASATQK